MCTGHDTVWWSYGIGVYKQNNQQSKTPLLEK